MPPMPYLRPSKNPQSNRSPWSISYTPCMRLEPANFIPTSSRQTSPSFSFLSRISAGPGLHLYLTLAVQFLLYLAFAVHCGTTPRTTTTHSPFPKAPCNFDTHLPSAPLTNPPVTFSIPSIDPLRGVRYFFPWTRAPLGVRRPALL